MNDLVMDNTVTGYEYVPHQPYANTSLSYGDEIRIPINNIEAITYPHESFLQIHGKLQRTGGEGARLNNIVSFGILSLFDSIHYEINGNRIESVRFPGLLAQVRALLLSTKDEENVYANAGFGLSTTEGAVSVGSSGDFSVVIPLRFFLSFVKDFQQTLVRVRQELVLVRSNSDMEALVDVGEAPTPSKIVLNRVRWYMPFLRVNDGEKLQMLQFLESGDPVEARFRSWEIVEKPSLDQLMEIDFRTKLSVDSEKPRYIISFFQTDRKNKIDKNRSLFDHLNLKQSKVYLNDRVFPQSDYSVNPSTGDVSYLYWAYANFAPSYDGCKRAKPLMSLDQFLNQGFVIVTDCSKQVDLPQGVVDARSVFELRTAAPANSAAYNLVISDKVITINIQEGTVQSE